MSERITFKMVDGTTREFKHQGRPGGSYTIRLTFEGEFAVVTNEWGDRTAIPGCLIAEVTEHEGRRW